jgi:hypothetical protein
MANRNCPPADMRTAHRRTPVLRWSSGEGRHLFVGSVVVDDLGDVVGEVFGGGSAEADGDDDGAVGPAQPDHPGVVGWPTAGAGRYGVDLDGEVLGAQRGHPLAAGSVLPDTFVERVGVVVGDRVRGARPNDQTVRWRRLAIGAGVGPPAELVSWRCPTIMAVIACRLSWLSMTPLGLPVEPLV